MAEITLAKALKVKNRLAGRLAKVQADIQAYNSVPAGQADQDNVPALVQTRAERVGALLSLKTATNGANRETQRDIYPARSDDWALPSSSRKKWAAYMPVMDPRKAPATTSPTKW